MLVVFMSHDPVHLVLPLRMHMKDVCAAVAGLLQVHCVCGARACSSHQQVEKCHAGRVKVQCSRGAAPLLPSPCPCRASASPQWTVLEGL